MALGPAKGYTDLLDEATTAALRKEREEGRAYQKTPIRPSSSGECARALYYDLMQFQGRAKYETELIDPKTSRLFALGHSIEWHLIKQLEQLPEFDIRYKQQILSFAYLEAKDPKLAQWFEGSLDLVLWSPQYKCVVDVKSKKDRFSAFHRSAWDESSEKLEKLPSVQKISDTAYWVEDLEAFLIDLNDDFFAANFLQLNMYACSQFLRERSVDHAAIIQYSKNDSRLREVRFKPSEKLFQKIISKMQNVIRAVDEDNIDLAPKEFILGSVKCAYCKFRKQCWPTADATKSFYKTLPAKDWPKDTDRVGKTGRELETLFEARFDKERATEELETLEEQILKKMMDGGLTKIRLENGEVYEAKQMKSGGPRGGPRVALRRTKA